jgi:hypothetical protein
VREHFDFLKISEEMKEWSAALGRELSGWPQVTARSMFGMTVYYRKGVVFAALPRTRSFETPTSIAFKLHRKTPRVKKMLAADSRIDPSSAETGRWIALQLRSDKDLADALQWFALAYRVCLSSNNSKR